jgi:regulator of nonsense transcripts 3
MIDQDEEYVSFVQELKNPLPSKANIDGNLLSDPSRKSETKVTTTPLVEYLKNKKAEKAMKKDAHSGKGQKQSRAEGKENRQKNSDKRGDKRTAKGDKESAKAGSDSKKVLVNPKIEKPPHRKGQTQASVPKADTASRGTAQQNTASAPSKPQVKANTERKRDRKVLSAAQILHRDLGIKNAATATTTVNSTTSQGQTSTEPTGLGQTVSSSSTAGTSSTLPATIPTQPSARNSRRDRRDAERPPRGDRRLNNSSNIAEETAIKSASGQATTGKSGVAASSVPTQAESTGAIQAPAPSAPITAGFVKNVDIIQGVTEPLLRETLSSYGVVTSLIVDSIKCFAFVEFAEASQLQAAISSSPLSIAKGKVSVLERKSKDELQRGKGARGRGGRGGRVAGAERGENKPTTIASSSTASAGDGTAQVDVAKGNNRGGGRSRGRGGRGQGSGRGRGGAKGGAPPAQTSSSTEQTS